MDSAHRFTEANINENSSKGKGDMERTRNSGLKMVTCSCNLESAWLSKGFCTLSN